MSDKKVDFILATEREKVKHRSWQTQMMREVADSYIIPRAEFGSSHGVHRLTPSSLGAVIYIAGLRSLILKAWQGQKTPSRSYGRDG
jgi:hypothetical protein